MYNCSTNCKCYYSPKKNVHTIDCSRKNIIDTSSFNINTFKRTSSILLNLSNDLLDVLPNLTSYSITHLDISYNNITTLDANLLPKGLKVRKFIII